ncbi:unnamed protein product [Cyclocybe aegerita]|uniref:Uncharacterized protein n=1 Tax=Cyclocybe aegerita TaxID=1973307 RepID=A0A8S0WC15_CYCAE|nr:unnamed protein product [Cyclocybe aegerita]
MKSLHQALCSLTPTATSSAELLKQLHECRCPEDPSPEHQAERLLNQLTYQDFPALRRAKAKLTVASCDKKIDIFFQARITGMVGTLNLYLDPQLSYSWHQVSLIAAKAAGCGPNHAQNLWTWIQKYLRAGKLPLHRYGTYHLSILKDKDFASEIQGHLSEISQKGYIHARDIVDYIATLEVQQQLGTKARGISDCTARCWL